MKSRYHRVWACLLFLGLASILGLAGCAGQAEPKPERLDAITVRESGFGTFADVADRNLARERLKARRASRLDAYRNLAERVYGTVIYGGSTVDEFVLENDQFRSYVDSYIRGAKVVAVNEHEDGVVETIMELKLEPRFRECVAAVAPANTPRLCPIPMPGLSSASGDLEARGDADSLYYLE